MLLCLISGARSLENLMFGLHRTHRMFKVGGGVGGGAVGICRRAAHLRSSLHCSHPHITPGINRVQALSVLKVRKVWVCLQV